MNAYRNFLSKITEINARYAKSRIEMSGAVRVSLMTLRVYLIVLVALMIYKFVQIAVQG